MSVKLYTDGGARPTNPGPGGWAAIALIEQPERMKRVLQWSGREELTTNNRMELTAVFAGLDRLMELGLHTDDVTVISDSAYVVSGCSHWLAGWIKRGWRTGDGKPVKNDDLWKGLAIVLGFFQNLTFEHIKGHSGDMFNDLADDMATAAALGG